MEVTMDDRWVGSVHGTRTGRNSIQYGILARRVHLPKQPCIVSSISAQISAHPARENNAGNGGHRCGECRAAAAAATTRDRRPLPRNFPRGWVGREQASPRIQTQSFV